MKKINTLNIFATLSIFFGFGFLNVIRYSKESFWISILIGTILGCIIITIVNNVFLVQSKIKPSKKIIAILMCLVATIILYNLCSFLSAILFNNSSISLIVVALSVTLINSYLKNKDTIKKITNISAFICLLLLLLIITSLISEIDVNNFYPLINYNAIGIWLGTISYTIFSVGPFLLFNFCEKLNGICYSTKQQCISYLIASSILLLFFTLIIGVLGVNISAICRYPEYIMFKKITLFNFLNNVENICAFFGIIIQIVLLMNISNIIHYKQKK